MSESRLLQLKLFGVDIERMRAEIRNRELRRSLECLRTREKDSDLVLQEGAATLCGVRIPAASREVEVELREKLLHVGSLAHCDAAHPQQVPKGMEVAAITGDTRSALLRSGWNVLCTTVAMGLVSCSSISRNR